MQPNTQNLPQITSQEAQLQCQNLNEMMIQAMKVHLSNLGTPTDTNEFFIEIPPNTCIVSHPYLGDKVEVSKITYSKEGDFLTIFYHDWEEESDLNELNFSSLELAKVLLQIEKAIGQK